MRILEGLMAAIDRGDLAASTTMRRFIEGALTVLLVSAAEPQDRILDHLGQGEPGRLHTSNDRLLYDPVVRDAATTDFVALGYTRVSTGEQVQSGAGLAAQVATIEAECQRKQWTLAQVHEDPGASARSLKRRPALADALARLERGEAHALVVAKTDRLSRSVRDFADLLDTSKRQGWALVACDLGVDTSTPSGEAMATVMAVFAQLERRLIGQRTKEALAVKKAEGVRLGRPRSLDPTVVARIVEATAAGESLAAIARGLNRDGVPTAQGGKAWYPSTVKAVLKSSERR